MSESEEAQQYFDALVSGVTKITNTLMKRKGYAVTIQEEQVKIVLESYFLLRSEALEKEVIAEQEI